MISSFLSSQLPTLDPRTRPRWPGNGGRPPLGWVAGEWLEVELGGHIPAARPPGSQASHRDGFSFGPRLSISFIP